MAVVSEIRIVHLPEAKDTRRAHWGVFEVRVTGSADKRAGLSDVLKLMAPLTASKRRWPKR